MDAILDKHKEIWQNKKLLRDIYSEWYAWIIGDLVLGKTLELGSGSGNFKEFKPDVITSDIDPKPWLDMHFDAHDIPLKDESLNNIVMIDVLHHLNDPIKFFNEAYRVLNHGGRVVMIEPYPSFLSLLVYRLFHPEPFIFDVDYFDEDYIPAEKHPWDSNQAIPYLLFYKQKKQFEEKYKNRFDVIKNKRFSYLLYPLSGGFENTQLIPEMLIPGVKFVEKLLTPFSSLMSFRIYIVVEKI